MFDKNDPIWHNTSDPAQALAAGIARHNRWAAGQPKKVRDLFCEHAQYTGGGKLLYLCKLGCNDDDN